MRCLQCNKESEDKFCTKQHKWDYETKINAMIPPIENPDKLTDKENSLIADYIKKNGVKT